jgi:hypothetical protein
MCAYLKTQGIARYIEEYNYVWPLVWTPELQAEYSAPGILAERRKELRENRKDYEDAVDSDNIASGIIQLKISSSLHHLCLADDTAVTTRYGLLHYANLIRWTGPLIFFQPT